MNPFISIPREALAELLRAAGSPLTPEQYLASLPEVSTYKKYPGRTKAAAISRNFIRPGGDPSLSCACSSALTSRT